MDRNLEEFYKENKKNLDEMMEFWNFIRSLNKFLKWIAFVLAGVVAAIWGIIQLFKKH